MPRRHVHRYVDMGHGMHRCGGVVEAVIGEHEELVAVTRQDLGRHVEVEGDVAT